MDAAVPIEVEVLDKFRTYPVMTRSMLSVGLFSYTSAELGLALEQLVESGQLLRGAKPGKKRSTSFFYLASEAERLSPFVERVQK